MAPFDPYHKWLGIPPDQQPVSHYRLLGIEDFELDADVIEGAAEQRTIYLRTFQTGPNSELAERLLNEVSEARVCLLTAADKADYDKRLQSSQEPGQPVVAEDVPAKNRDWTFATAELPDERDGRLFEPEELPLQETDPLAYSPDEWAPSDKEAAAQRRRAAKSQQPFWKQPLFFPIAGIGVVVVVVLLMLITSGGDPSSPGDKPEVADKQNGLVTSQQEEERQATIAAEKSAADREAERLAVAKAAADEVAAKSAMAPPPAITPFDADEAKSHQKAWAGYLGKPIEMTNSIGMKLKLIPAGEFQMGSPDSDGNAPPDEKPQHRVKITKPFYLGVYEVTQQQYEKVMGINPSNFRGPNHPVDQVTWNDSREFCRKLSALLREEAAGRMYFLPTEAQWEYACRAGTDTSYFWGEAPGMLNFYAWTGPNAGRQTHPVGEKNPNAWGLHDIRGNLYEWINDWMEVNYYGKSPLSDPRGPDAGSFHVIRGGGWNNFSISNSRSASRGIVDGTKRRLRAGFIPGHSDRDVGFRVASTYDLSPAVKPPAEKTVGSKTPPPAIAATTKSTDNPRSTVKRGPNAPPDGFTALFNGKDLTGWKGLVENPKTRAKMTAEQLAESQKNADNNMRAHWIVQKGVLVFDGKGQSLCTVKDYGDFELYVDWKIEPKGDSGIYLRGSPQVQICDPNDGPRHVAGSGGLYNNKKNSSNPQVRADNPIRQWNTFYIKMVGERVTVRLNGQLVVDNVVFENYWERDKPIYSTGAIELQSHGSTLYFRNLFLRAIPRN